MPTTNDNRLGDFLKARRGRLDPAALGYPMARRRTPGLRREEVAQRANISATWYTWLEQGRGGAPSASVLEREHLFLLGLGHPPEAHYRDNFESVTPRLQRVLDALPLSPAFVKTPTWDIVAWNRAAEAVLGIYGEGAERNILRRLFSDRRARDAQIDWERVSRFAVAAFRADAARAGDQAAVQMLVDELIGMSPEFEALWNDNHVRTHGGTKRLRHPEAGLIALEYSAFAVDGRADLTMVVYNPLTREDAERIRSVIDEA